MFACLLASLLFALPLLLVPSADAQAQSARGQWTAAGKPAKQWATEAAQAQLHDFDPGGPYLRYRTHVVDKRGDQVRDTIQSKDGTVARVIFRDGHPITSAEDAAEHSRLQDMLDSPAAFTKHVKSDDSSKKAGMDVVRLLPDAMLYTYTEGQPQRTGAGNEVVLDFTPDPNWSPPTMFSQALTGIRGRMWIDPRTHHLQRLEASVFKPVNLGWGLLGHVYPGGTLVLNEAHPAENRWIYSHFAEHLTIRAMMVKTIHEDSEIDASNFQPIGAVSYQDAIHALLATPLPH